MDDGATRARTRLPRPGRGTHYCLPPEQALHPSIQQAPLGRLTQPSPPVIELFPPLTPFGAIGNKWPGV
eukprot:1090630-Pyramimonas_sp.AAC.1